MDDYERPASQSMTLRTLKITFKIIADALGVKMRDLIGNL